MIPIESGQLNPRWKFQPTWYAYSPNFLHLGRKYGYRRWQAEMWIALAVTVDVLSEERFWSRWTRRRA